MIKQQLQAKSKQKMDVDRMHTYIISVDVPGHIAVWDQLPVDVAADFTVPPAVVNVYNADHVPLQKPTEEKIIKIIIAVLTVKRPRFSQAIKDANEKFFCEMVICIMTISRELITTCGL